MTNPHDAAFPAIDEHLQGLTKRELFASQAMAGVMASSDSLNPEFIAEFSVEAADALIEALNNPKP